MPRASIKSRTPTVPFHELEEIAMNIIPRECRDCGRPDKYRCELCKCMHPFSPFYGRIPSRVGVFLWDRFGIGKPKPEANDE